MDPFLVTVQDPIPFLQDFAQRYCNGKIAPSGNIVTANYVSDVLHLIGQAFSILGAPDPRLTAMGGGEGGGGYIVFDFLNRKTSCEFATRSSKSIGIST